MKASELRVGDKIRIIAVPGEGLPGYVIHKETVRVFKKIIARNRSVRVCEIDEYGTPWYTVRFRGKNGTQELHFLAVFQDETNWVRVNPRKRNAHAKRQPK